MFHVKLKFVKQFLIPVRHRPVVTRGVGIIVYYATCILDDRKVVDRCGKNWVS